MQPLIETLEARQMFSVAGYTMMPEFRPHVSAPHSAVLQTAPIMFAGTSQDANGQTSQLQMTVIKTSGGFAAQVRITTESGKTTTLKLTSGEGGALTFHGRIFGQPCTIRAQINSDHNAITGSFSTVTAGGTADTGTISLSRTLVSTMTFAGSGTGNDGKVGHLTATVTSTIAGYVAFVQCVNPDGSVGSVIITGDASGHFVYNTANLQIDAQLSTDGNSLNGSFTSASSDHSTNSVNFTLNRK